MITLGPHQKSAESVKNSPHERESSLNNNNDYGDLKKSFPHALKDSSTKILDYSQPKNEVPNLLMNLSDDMFVLEAPSFVVPYLYEKPAELEIKSLIPSVKNPEPQPKTDNKDVFSSPLGHFFMDLGLGLVQHSIQQELLSLAKQRKKKSVKKAILTSLDLFPFYVKEAVSKMTKTCKQCGFKADSFLVMENHYQYPHSRENSFRCTRCAFTCRLLQDIKMHNFTVHSGMTLHLNMTPSLHCPLCPFSCFSITMLTKHAKKCLVNFDAVQNQAPPIDWEIPAKFQRIVPVPKSILLTKEYENGKKNMKKAEPRPAPKVVSMLRPLPQIRPKAPMRGCFHPPTRLPYVLQSSPQPVSKLLPVEKAPPYVVCEMCDGYIPNLLQLRDHLRICHQLSLGPLLPKGPLNCSKCPSSFYTDDGLERHLLGLHCLVGPNLQKAASQKKDGGFCCICKKICHANILHHMKVAHGFLLKTVNVSYICTVCKKQFDQYSMLKSHLRSHGAGLGK